MIIATVKGDVHDIGKNIVKVVVENYGYEVVDLGKDVSTSQLLEAIEKEGTATIGLSALMTTTAENMKEIIKDIKKLYPQSKIMVGGAVLTSEYAEKIGADYYCKDANATVKALDEIYKQ